MKQRLQPAEDQKQMRGEYRRRPVMPLLSYTTASLSVTDQTDSLFTFNTLLSGTFQTALQMKQVILYAGYEHFNPVKSTE